VIGQKINTFSVQQTVAEYIGQSLTETSITARADRLRITFGKMSQEGKKVLVILDDVWEMVELNDIGLSPLPTGFKLLLTSRNETICTKIAVEANSDFKVVKVDVMEESEANNFFCQITDVSEESDPVLNEMGNQIVKRCGFLPLAIKLIATTLKSQENFVWRDTLNRLKKSDLDENVQEIIEISYTFILEEDVKAIFLLCGLFPEDSNIPVEDLTRYAWGLKLLKEVPTLGCVDLLIDEGVFKSLVFTDANFNELAQCSRNLSALEIEFFENKAQPKNMSFKKLERFRISVGSAGEIEYSEENSKSMHSFENTLNLITTKDELMESRLNELFPKTEVLFLEANGMNDIVELLVASVRPTGRSFFNLRELQISKCADLRYLFTVPVANGLVKLERLTIMECPVMEVVAYSENGAQGVIKFQELKFLKLSDLPMLVGFCNTISLIELPQLVELILDGLPNFTSIYPDNQSSTSSLSSSAIQPFLSKEVVIPKLETLRVFKMEALQNIWPYQFCSSGDVSSCILREIGVEKCDNLVNIFPSNPMPLLHHLIHLHVRKCGSLEFIFNIDVECVGEIEEGCSGLRNIAITKSGEIREVWRLKGVVNPDVIIRGFQAVESIYTDSCKSFRNLFTPTFARFDLGALERLNIDGEHYNLKSKININESAERSDEYLLSACMIKILSSLDNIYIEDCDAIEEVVSNGDDEYEEVAASSQTDTTFLPRFDYLRLYNLPHLKLIDGTVKVGIRSIFMDVSKACQLCSVSSETINSFLVENELKSEEMMKNGEQNDSGLVSDYNTALSVGIWTLKGASHIS
nr:NB-ARC domains-containing protein [Tanacetum cinerariifolium]